MSAPLPFLDHSGVVKNQRDERDLMLRVALGLLSVALSFGLARAETPNQVVEAKKTTQSLTRQSIPISLAGLKARVWVPLRTSKSRHLLVVIHGDLAGANDSYQYLFAQAARDALLDTMVVAVLRPGYADRYGARSPGDHGLATGDNYTPQVINALRAAIVSAQALYAPDDTTLVGHSGGAALAADLAEADPKLAQKLLLVSCPCDLKSWRLHMALKQANPAWLLPVRSRSPSEGISRLAHTLTMKMVVGEQDVVALPSLSLAFANTAHSFGVRTSVKILSGAGHAVLLDRRVVAELVSLQASP
jgi:predicted esterase